MRAGKGTITARQGKSSAATEPGSIARPNRGGRRTAELRLAAALRGYLERLVARIRRDFRGLPYFPGKELRDIWRSPLVRLPVSDSNPGELPPSWETIRPEPLIDASQ